MIQNPVARSATDSWLRSPGISCSTTSSKPDLLGMTARTFSVQGGIGAYLHCTADPPSLWHRNIHRGLGDRTRRTCIPLVHCTFPYKFCQMCAVHKLLGGEKDASESNMQPLEMCDSSFKGSVLDQWTWTIIQSQLWHRQGEHTLRAHFTDNETAPQRGHQSHKPQWCRLRAAQTSGVTFTS